MDLRDFLGMRPVVLFFYPKGHTTGYSKEANDKGLKSGHVLALRGPDLEDRERSGMM